MPLLLKETIDYISHKKLHNIHSYCFIIDSIRGHVMQFPLKGNNFLLYMNGKKKEHYRIGITITISNDSKAVLFLILLYGCT